jgi:IS5 family transposase
VALKVPTRRHLGGGQKRRNPKMFWIRSRVEYVFRVMKRQFGYTRIRYRSLAKNTAQVLTLIGRSDLLRPQCAKVPCRYQIEDQTR